MDYWFFWFLSRQLIVFFSKSLLRHPKARSELKEMVGESNFLRYLPDTHDSNLVAPEEIKRHILCTGKVSFSFLGWCCSFTLYDLIGQVYFALTQAREDRGIKDVAISRIEQLSPFPYDLVRTLSPTFWKLKDWKLITFLFNFFRLLRIWINTPTPAFSGARQVILIIICFKFNWRLMGYIHI